MKRSYVCSSPLADRLELLLVEEPGFYARDGGFIRAAVHAPLDDVRSLRDESRRVIDLFEKHKTPLNMYVELPSLEAIKRFVAMGNGVALVPGLTVQQELERNKASDLERKTSRDIQAKQVEDALKELQKGLQDCREKLARLEGAKPADVKPAGGTTPEKPQK